MLVRAGADAPNTQVKDEDVKALVKWVLSLKEVTGKPALCRLLFARIIGLSAPHSLVHPTHSQESFHESSHVAL